MTAEMYVVFTTREDNNGVLKYESCAFHDSSNSAFQLISEYIDEHTKGNGYSRKQNRWSFKDTDNQSITHVSVYNIHRPPVAHGSNFWIMFDLVSGEALRILDTGLINFEGMNYDIQVLAEPLGDLDTLRQAKHMFPMVNYEDIMDSMGQGVFILKTIEPEKSILFKALG